MTYRIAGIDVHKKVLAVVVADVETRSEYEFNAGGAGPAGRICASCPSG